MASITSLTGSSSSASIYSNANSITGLASGLDTEAMIEQAVSAYEKKIANLQQDKTKVEWEQTEYRGLIDKMADFMEKYADYMSDTNLSSSSFFNSAKVTSASGTYANQVSVTGEAQSQLSIMGVKQLATAATYTVAGGTDKEGKQWTVGSTLEDMLTSFAGLESVTETVKVAKTEEVVKTVTAVQMDENGQEVLDENGNPVTYEKEVLDENGNKVYETVEVKDADGNVVYEEQQVQKYVLKINDKEIGSYAADTKLSTIINDINKSDAGVSASYSNLTGRFQFTAKETGADSSFTISGGLAEALFGTTEGSASYAAGQDAILVVEANGAATEITRSSNKVELDGLTVNLKGTFAAYTESTAADGKTVYTATSDAVKFSTSTDSDKIVDTVKSMIEDYNEMVTAIKKSYSTKPLKTTEGKPYEPLTDDDRADMSETAIENYEKKAKTGLLYADQDLSSMSNELVNAITKHVVDLEKIGITTAYSDGLTTLKLDESKMKSALENDPNAVSDVFAGTDGFVSNINTVTKKYGATTGVDKGILVMKAGSERAATTVNQNSLQTIMDEYQEQIKKWQEKLTDKIDYYTSMFTRLETMISNMNSQSSALAGMMGGY